MSSIPLPRLRFALAMGIGGALLAALALALLRASLLVLLFVPLLAPAQDTARGRLLYETHCGGCHYERVHERLRTEVKDLSDLRDIVARWAPQTKRTYTLDELDSIVHYLNESHYRFGLPAREPMQHPHGR